MKNLKLLFLMLGLLTAGSSYADPNVELTLIKGHLNFEVQQNVVLHSVVDGELSEYSTTKVDANGDFAFALPANQPGFYYIDYGQMPRKGQLIRLYLEPGLDLRIDITDNDYSLSGKKVGHNKLVQEANRIYNAFAPYHRLGGNVTYQDFYPFLKDKGVTMVRDFIGSIKTRDTKFNEFLKLAVQADFEEAVFAFFFLPRSKHPEMDHRPAIIKELKEEGMKFTDLNILRLGNGLRWMEQYFLYRGFETGFKDKLNMISKNVSHISEDRIKEVYIRSMIERRNFDPYEYTKVMEPLRKYMTSEKSKEFLLQYEKTFHKNVGQPGFEFTYTDVNDEPVSFKDFRGKYVYVDLWATWCQPCIKEIPHLKKLEHDFRDEDIVFLSISIDAVKDRQKWKDFVKSEGLGGVQIMADKAFESGIAQNYEVNAIPRFLLFDKEGKIVSTDAMRPSNPELKNMLTELLNPPVQ